MLCLRVSVISTRNFKFDFLFSISAIPDCLQAKEKTVKIC